MGTILRALVVSHLLTREGLSLRLFIALAVFGFLIFSIVRG
jgi:hypothetical protein